MNQKAFSKIWLVSIILTFFIILTGGVLIYLLISKVTKAEIPCSLPYFTECKTSRDCLSQTKCQAGQGIICLPQCKYEKYDFSCVNDICVWSRSGKGPLEKDLIPLQ